MIKMVIFFKRQPDMSVEAFQSYWRTRHAEIVLRLPGVRRYVQSHTLATSYRRGEPAYDGVAETWFDDTQAMKTLAKSAEYQAVLEDEPKFIDRGTMGSIITEEHVMKEGALPSEAVKAIDFVRHKAGMSIDDFFAYWRGNHAALCSPLPAVLRYVQCHTRRSIYDSGRTPAYDGAAMTWFEDMQALRTAAASEEFARLRADVVHFVDRERSPSVLTQEHVFRS